MGVCTYIAVLWVSELVLGVSELIPLYVGCLNSYFGCLNLFQSPTKWSGTLLLTPPSELIPTEPWSLEAQGENNRRGKESHTPDDPKGSADF